MDRAASNAILEAVLGWPVQQSVASLGVEGGHLAPGPAPWTPSLPTQSHTHHLPNQPPSQPASHPSSHPATRPPTHPPTHTVKLVQAQQLRLVRQLVPH